MRAIVGHTDEPDAPVAMDQLLEDLRCKLSGKEPKAALLFCSVDYDHDVVLGRIQEEWPGLPLVGATTDGEISSELGFCDDSIVLTLFSGDDVRVHAGVGESVSEDIDAAVANATEGASALKPTICLTTFAPSTNAVAVLDALARHLGGARCPVVGGLSGDHREFSHATEFFGGRALTDSMPLLLLEGDFDVSWGIGSGWVPHGDVHTVTRSEGHIVHEIDGRPAVETYSKHYGEVPTGSLGEYPLAVYRPDGEWELRAVLGYEEGDSALRFAGEVPEGSEVRITAVLTDGLLSGSAEALDLALDRMGDSSPELAIVFSCAARKWVLGSEAEEEISILRKVASDRGAMDLAIVGMYCFGEIAPHDHDPTRMVENGFHNETCVSVVFGA